ncbi:MAG: IS66 family transposase [Steroidobacteraceae bacterium]
MELSRAFMSEWLVQRAELLEGLHRRMVVKVLDSGHVYTDDTTLPLRKPDPIRRKTYEAKSGSAPRTPVMGLRSSSTSSPSPAPGMRPWRS